VERMEGSKHLSSWEVDLGLSVRVDIMYNWGRGMGYS